MFMFFFFKQKTAYEMRISDWSSDVCSSDLQVYGAKVPAYTLVDLDARLPLDWAGLNDKTFLQLNVSNLFDELYVGGFSGGLPADSAPFVQIGSPRALDRKSTRLNSSHYCATRMPSSD